MKKMFVFLTIAVLMLLTAPAESACDPSYQTPIYTEQGGAAQKVCDGGSITVESGGGLSLAAGSSFSASMEPSFSSLTVTNRVTAGSLNVSGNEYHGAALFRSTFTGADGSQKWTGALESAGNITGAKFDSGNGATEIFDMDQDLKSTDAPDFVTVNTGQGDNELYPMNQAVRTTDDVLYKNVEVSFGLKGSTVEASGKITGGTFESGQGETEIYLQNQNLRSTDDVTHKNINATFGFGGSTLALSGGATAGGDIVVTDASLISTTSTGEYGEFSKNSLTLRGNSAGATVTATAYGGTGSNIPIMNGRVARGTFAAPTEALTNDIGLFIGGSGWSGDATATGFPASAPATITAEAAQTQSPTARGFGFRFRVTPKDSVFRSTGVIITSDGDLIVQGSNTGYDNTVGQDASHTLVVRGDAVVTSSFTAAGIVSTDYVQLKSKTLEELMGMTPTAEGQCFWCTTGCTPHEQACSTGTALGDYGNAAGAQLD